MSFFRRCSSLLCLVLLIFSIVLPAEAWNYTGHRIIAAIAYDRLTPEARAKVDELIKAHPDYTRIFTANAPADPAVRARHAFVVAATWPDLIRNDTRFYDETVPGYVETPVLNGFPTMSRHVTWHYYDIPYAPDGAKPEPQRPPHALSELRRMLGQLTSESRTQAVYDLPWLLHLTGDVHQPLHATSRFLQSQPKGDAGGNFVYVAPNTNLHAYWDSLPGTDTSDEYVNRYAASVTAEYPNPGKLSSKPKRWLKESFQIDKTDVYSFGLITGTKEAPITLPAGYHEKAEPDARRRIAEAGYRLANVLNARFK